MTNADMIKTFNDDDLIRIYLNCPILIEKNLKIDSKWKCQTNNCFRCKKKWLKKEFEGVVK